MAKKEIGAGTLLSPLPVVLVTCGDIDGESNVFTAAWTGILNTKPPKAYVSVRPERYSHGIIKSRGEFVLNLVPESLTRIADSCGVKSGRDIDKFAEYGLTRERADRVACPTLAECPLSLECRVSDVISLGSHDMFIADVLGVSADVRLIKSNGRLDMTDAGLVSYMHGGYYALGEKLGSFGFSVRKKKRIVRRK